MPDTLCAYSALSMPLTALSAVCVLQVETPPPLPTTAANNNSLLQPMEAADFLLRLGLVAFAFIVAVCGAPLSLSWTRRAMC